MNAIHCPFGHVEHAYTTVVEQHYQVPSPDGNPLDRTYTFVVCSKCGDIIEVDAGRKS